MADLRTPEVEALLAAFAGIESSDKEEQEFDKTLNGYFEELGLTWRL